VTALLIGAALAVAALVYVLFPLFDEVVVTTRQRGTSRAQGSSETAIDALREIEFDRATGKLSDDDYASLKAAYTRSALAELRAKESHGSTTVVVAPRPAVVAPNVVTNGNSAGAHAVVASNGSSSDVATDPVEAAVLRYRSVRRTCETCGPRPEPDPAFCSACGKYLKGSCANCGAVIDAPASRFCANCGASLAA
jgi:cytochrome c-type biogenesis protein CcmI